LKVVECMNIEEVFVQIILLLPEYLKTQLFKDLVKSFNQNSINDSPALIDILMREASTNYIRNIMLKHDDIGQNILGKFYWNLILLLPLMSKLNAGKKSIHWFSLLDNILGDIESSQEKLAPLKFNQSNQFNKYNSNGLNLLNNHDNQYIVELYDYVKNKFQSNEKKKILMKDLLESKEHVEFCKRLFSDMIQDFKTFNLTDSNLLSNQNDATIATIIYKLEYYRYHSIEAQITDLIEELKEQIFKLYNKNENMTSALVNCSSIDQMHQTYDSSYGRYEGEFFLNKWRSITDKEEKFLLSLSRVCNNYYANGSELIDWLLKQEHFIEAYKEQFLSTLSSYICNFVSWEIMKTLADILFVDTVEKSLFKETLSKVFMISIPYLTLKSCNELILHCHCYHKHSDSTYYADEQKNTGLKSNESLSTLGISYSFLSNFNEDINKITEDVVDLKKKNEKQNSMNVLAKYCVLYPYEIIHEMSSRVFSKNINFTIFTKMLSSLPSLLKFTMDGINYVLHCLKKHYLKYYADDNTLDEILIKVVVQLLKICESTKEADVLLQTMTLFIHSNIHLNAENLFLKKMTTLKILETYIKHGKFIETLHSCKEYLVLSNTLVRYFDTSTQHNPIDICETHYLADKCLNSLVNQICKSYFSLQTDEQEEFLAMVEDTVKTLSCYESYRYYQLFNNVPTLTYTYQIPCKLFQHLNAEFTQVVPVKEIPMNECLWNTVINIWLHSKKFGKLLITQLDTFDGDESLPKIIDAILVTFTPVLSEFKGTSIIECLQYFVNEEKIKNISSYLSDDLQCETSHHASGFSMFILLQCFATSFNDVTNMTSYHVYNIQTYVILFHQFTLYARAISDPQTRGYFSTYFFEQLIYITSIVQNDITKKLSLLIKDVLSIALDSGCSHDNAMMEIIEQCENLLLRKELIDRVRKSVAK